MNSELLAAFESDDWKRIVEMAAQVDAGISPVDAQFALHLARAVLSFEQAHPFAATERAEELDLP